MGDWLAREGWMIVNWWLIVTLAGAAALPLAWRMLSSLPDRGYLLARPLGLLTIGFVYWLLNILGFLRNEVGGILLSALIVLGVGLFAVFRAPDYSGRQKRESLREWWARNRGAVIAGEIAFAAMFLLWAFVRAHQNNLVTTEKPMDLAFLASILRSPTFPPNDPWLSGYAISYYHFGYIIAAMITMTSGVIAGIGYNLWTAMLFALAGLSAFGVVYNLVRVRGTQQAAVLTGVIGLFAVAVMGNYLTPFVDEPYQNHVSDQSTLTFWDVRDRLSPLNENTPSWDYWWWWNSARVLHDRNLPGMGSEKEEVINEFPMFSYTLADNHPHVMALPFVLLAMGIGLSLALNQRRADTLMSIFCGITVGGLIFLNTWDAPIYIALIVGAEGLRRYADGRGRLTVDDGIALLVFLGGVAGVMLIAYLPFLVSFGSQLGGALPNLIHPTAAQQLFLAFGALFPLTLLFLGVEAWRGGRGLNLKYGAVAAFGTFFALLALMLILVLFGTRSSDWAGPQQTYLMSAGSEAFNAMIAKRLAYLFTTLLLVAGVFVVAARLFGTVKAKDGDALPYSITTGYALLLIAGALLLILTPDYVYLRDGFGSRMNTVFKFYYQAWALLAIACAYGVWSIASPHGYRPLPPAVRIGFSALAVFLLALGLDYPLRAVPERMFNETGRANNPNAAAITLDGSSTLTNANDYRAMLCLRDLTAGQTDIVAAEVSFHGSYDYFPGGIASGRLAGITGLPTVLGWQGHERQWRGRGYSAAIGTREQDIVTLYTDLRLDVVQPIIEQYGIDYIVYGSAERTRYGQDGEVKFREGLEIVCESGDTRVYRTSTALRAAEPLN
ncbi:MAG: hypothetical protein IPK52_09145 [Chloroflexi bacterium]|nr:hypothetical protein [Chloroflexota bacterium]